MFVCACVCLLLLLLVTLLLEASEQKLDHLLLHDSNRPCLYPIHSVPSLSLSVRCITRNNGECAPGQSYEAPNALCDCSTAIEVVGTAPNFGLARFVGKYCEVEVKANNFCSRDINLFCVNEGLCRVQAVNFNDQPCDCPDDYTGRHCEYKTEHVQTLCSLTCSGAGSCQHGISPNDDTGANHALNLDNGGTNDFMHCICDDGRAGNNCEYEYIKCGGENRYCYHGSACVAEGSGKEEVCECSNESGVKCKSVLLP